MMKCKIFRLCYLVEDINKEINEFLETELKGKNFQIFQSSQKGYTFITIWYADI